MSRTLRARAREENGFWRKSTAAAGHVIEARRTRLGGKLVHAGQVDLEGRPVTDLAVDGDVAAALLGDAVDRGEPQAGAGLALRREERLPDLSQGRRVHAGAGV